jgi:general stress protein 26
MGEIRDLQHTEAIERLRDMIGETKTCLFCTSIQTGRPFDTRPMSTQDVDDAGNIWFLSDEASFKNTQIRQDPHVQLLYTISPHASFLSVYGQAEVFFDREKIGALWEPIAKAWFKEGKDDPRIRVIKVTPEEGYYWDTKHGKMVSFLKILASVVSGKTADDGVEGKLRV